MAQGIKDLLAKPGELSLVEGEKVLSRLFSDLHMSAVACMGPHGQTLTTLIKKQKTKGGRTWGMRKVPILIPGIPDGSCLPHVSISPNSDEIVIILSLPR